MLLRYNATCTFRNVCYKVGKCDCEDLVRECNCAPVACTLVGPRPLTCPSHVYSRAQVCHAVKQQRTWLYCSKLCMRCIDDHACILQSSSCEHTMHTAFTLSQLNLFIATFKKKTLLCCNIF